MDMVLLSLFVLLLQDDGMELLQACSVDEWELAEGLIMSGSTLEAQDTVIFRLDMRLK